jgi:hypothetical protein
MERVQAALDPRGTGPFDATVELQLGAAPALGRDSHGRPVESSHPRGERQRQAEVGKINRPVADPYPLDVRGKGIPGGSIGGCGTAGPARTGLQNLGEVHLPLLRDQHFCARLQHLDLLDDEPIGRDSEGHFVGRQCLPRQEAIPGLGFVHEDVLEGHRPGRAQRWSVAFALVVDARRRGRVPRLQIERRVMGNERLKRRERDAGRFDLRFSALEVVGDRAVPSDGAALGHGQRSLEAHRRLALVCQGVQRAGHDVDAVRHRRLVAAIDERYLHALHVDLLDRVLPGAGLGTGRLRAFRG